jgi:hypothetical protein
MKILDKRFRYINALETDIRLTFAKVRARQRLERDWDEALAEDSRRSAPRAPKEKAA